MNIKVVETLFDYAQNLGSSEDIVTAALATAFAYCPDFNTSHLKIISVK